MLDQYVETNQMMYDMFVAQRNAMIDVDIWLMSN